MRRSWAFLRARALANVPDVSERDICLALGWRSHLTGQRFGELHCGCGCRLKNPRAWVRVCNDAAIGQL